MIDPYRLAQILHYYAPDVASCSIQSLPDFTHLNARLDPVCMFLPYGIKPKGLEYMCWCALILQISLCKIIAIKKKMSSSFALFPASKGQVDLAGQQPLTMSPRQCFFLLPQTDISGTSQRRSHTFANSQSRWKTQGLLCLNKATHSCKGDRQSRKDARHVPDL